MLANRVGTALSPLRRSVHGRKVTAGAACTGRPSSQRHQQQTFSSLSVSPRHQQQQHQQQQQQQQSCRQQTQGAENTAGGGSRNGRRGARRARRFIGGVASVATAAALARESLLPDVFFEWDDQVRGKILSWVQSAARAGKQRRENGTGCMGLCRSGGY